MFAHYEKPLSNKPNSHFYHCVKSEWILEIVADIMYHAPSGDMPKRKNNKHINAINIVYTGSVYPP